MRLRAEADCVQVLRHDAPRPRQPGHVAALQKEEVKIALLIFATSLGVNLHLRFKYILSCLFLRKKLSLCILKSLKFKQTRWI